MNQSAAPPSPRSRGEGWGEGLGVVITRVNRANESAGLIGIRRIASAPRPKALYGEG